MSVTERIKYHLAELDVATDPSAASHILPEIKPEHQAILDVGCGIGQTLVACELQSRELVVGIDIELGPLIYGAAEYADFNFANSSAESLPFEANTFELVFSRVALPYTNIPQSIAEISRVLKPGGEVWFTLHPLSRTRDQIVASAKKAAVKDVLFRLYVIFNGLYFNVSGKQLRWPVNKQFESFQNEHAMRSCLNNNGFGEIIFERGRHFKCQAVKH